MKKHISEVVVGDIVNHNGELLTVTANDIKYDSFLGYSLFGDSYSLGYKLVEVV